MVGKDVGDEVIGPDVGTTDTGADVGVPVGPCVGGSVGAAPPITGGSSVSWMFIISYTGWAPKAVPQLRNHKPLTSFMTGQLSPSVATKSAVGMTTVRYSVADSDPPSTYEPERVSGCDEYCGHLLPSDTVGWQSSPGTSFSTLAWNVRYWYTEKSGLEPNEPSLWKQDLTHCHDEFFSWHPTAFIYL